MIVFNGHASNTVVFNGRATTGVFNGSVIWGKPTVPLSVTVGTLRGASGYVTFVTPNNSSRTVNFKSGGSTNLEVPPETRFTAYASASAYKAVARSTANTGYSYSSETYDGAGHDGVYYTLSGILTDTASIWLRSGNKVILAEGGLIKPPAITMADGNASGYMFFSWNPTNMSSFHSSTGGWLLAPNPQAFYVPPATLPTVTSKLYTGSTLKTSATGHTWSWPTASFSGGSFTGKYTGDYWGLGTNNSYYVGVGYSGSGTNLTATGLLGSSSGAAAYYTASAIGNGGSAYKYFYGYRRRGHYYPDVASRVDGTWVASALMR